MPRPKIVAWLSWLALNMATWLNRSPRPACPSAEEGRHLRVVDDRQGNLPADAIDGQQQERQQDLLPQFGDREDDANLFPHGSIRRIGIRSWGLGFGARDPRPKP